jgi:Ca2+-binding RTX toxin-like protein
VEVLARPRLGTLPLVLIAALFAAPAAHAAANPHVDTQLRADGTTIVRYVAAAKGQHNEVTMRIRAEAIDPYKRQLGILDDTGVDFYDIGADGIDASGPLCKPEGTGVGCDVPGTKVEVRAMLGDGDDSLQPEYDRRRQTRAVVQGGPGEDVLQDWSSVPTAIDFSGGPGIDAVDYFDRKNQPFSFTEDSLFNDGLGHDRIHGDVELWVGGEADDAWTFTGTGRHIVFGTGGDDTMVSGPGADELDGGYGGDANGSDAPSNDTVTYAGRPTGVSVTLDGFADDGARGEGDYILPTVEQVIGTDHNDVIVGPVHVPDHRPYRLTGGAGDDVLSGGGGTDYIDAGDGNDTVIALGGRKDAIKCGAGTDVVVADTSDLLRDCERVSHSLVQAASRQTGGTVLAKVAVPAPRSKVSAELLDGKQKVGSATVTLGAGIQPLRVALNSDAKKALHKARSLPLKLRVKIRTPAHRTVSGSKTVTLAEG